MRKEKNIMVLQADKERVMVVFDKEYLDKCNQLLSDVKTYQNLKGDTTAKYKNELVSMLKYLKDRKVIDQNLHKKMYLTTNQSPCFYGRPKVHKANMLLRPIVSFIGTISYGCAQYMATKVLSPLVGKTSQYVKNLKEFASEVRNLRIGPDDELRSHALLCWPCSQGTHSDQEFRRYNTEGKNAHVTRRHSQVAWLVSEVHVLPVPGRILPLNPQRSDGFTSLTRLLCATSTWRSLIRRLWPLVCSIYMEKFDQEALATAKHPP